MIILVEILGGTLNAVKNIVWEDRDTWVEVEIPFGDIKFQQPKGKQVQIRLECYDWDSLYTLFFNTDIGDGNYIVNPDTWKKTVFSTDGSQFIVTVKTLSGTYELKFYDVRLRTIGPSEMMESDDIVYIIELTAKYVKRTV